MNRIEIDVITGDKRIVEVTKEEIKALKEQEKAYLASLTWDDIRSKRDSLIAQSDWTMIPGATVDQHAWAVYRQILRDIPQTFAATGPQSVIWPERPSTIGPNQKAAEYAEAIKAEIEGVKIDEDSTAS